MYEHYTHYVPGDSEAMRRFAVQLSTNYANLSDAVFAPSEAVAAILHRRGVQVPVHVVPTGVRLEDFAGGSGKGFRAILAIPESAFLVGHVGRLAPEKNSAFLAGAVARFLEQMPSAYAVIVGGGPSIPACARFCSGRAWRSGSTLPACCTGSSWSAPIRPWMPSRSRL